jgi:hypothetical protein
MRKIKDIASICSNTDDRKIDIYAIFVIFVVVIALRLQISREYIIIITTTTS